MRELTILNCAGCPFAQFVYNGKNDIPVCFHPDGNRHERDELNFMNFMEFEKDVDQIPVNRVHDDCPLKRGCLTMRLAAPARRSSPDMFEPEAVCRECLCIGCTNAGDNCVGETCTPDNGTGVKDCGPISICFTRSVDEPVDDITFFKRLIKEQFGDDARLLVFTTFLIFVGYESEPDRHPDICKFVGGRLDKIDPKYWSELNQLFVWENVDEELCARVARYLHDQTDVNGRAPDDEIE